MAEYSPGKRACKTTVQSFPQKIYAGLRKFSGCGPPLTKNENLSPEKGETQLALEPTGGG